VCQVCNDESARLDVHAQGPHGERGHYVAGDELVSGDCREERREGRRDILLQTAVDHVEDGRMRRRREFGGRMAGGRRHQTRVAEDLDHPSIPPSGGEGHGVERGPRGSDVELAPEGGDHPDDGHPKHARGSELDGEERDDVCGGVTVQRAQEKIHRSRVGDHAL
jgi:hypothetical protein